MERVLLDGFDVEVSSTEQDTDKGKESYEKLLFLFISNLHTFFFPHRLMQLIYYIEHRCKYHKREIK